MVAWFGLLRAGTTRSLYFTSLRRNSRQTHLRGQTRAGGSSVPCWRPTPLSRVNALTAIAPHANPPAAASTTGRIRVDRRPLFALATLVGISAVVRGLVAIKHTTPHYFPDEYIYAALGRSLAHGHLQIRGHTSHFPGILEPLVAAPLWRFFSTTTAYHLVQVENAVFVSLAAIPIYLLARWLRLGQASSLLCALIGLLLPELTRVGLVLSDLVAYPLILTTVLLGVVAIDAPTKRRQLAFLVLATLSALARVEYAVVVVAYVIAAVAVERRRVLRTHRVALTAIVPAALAIVAGAVGYYLPKGAGTLELHPFPLAHWFVLQAFLLTVATGVVLVPGAAAFVLRPQGRRETIYAVFLGSLVLLILAVATEPAATTSRFKERYLFALVPLLAIAFVAYLRRRPLRPLVLVLALGVAIALANFPLSGYTASLFKGDSQFLWGVWFLQTHFGTSSGALYVALAATVGCALAIAVAYRRLERTALAAAVVFLATFATLSNVEDLHASHGMRGELPRNLTWVDDAARGRLVTAIDTTRSPSVSLREALFWNPSIQREVVLPGAVATDGFSAPPLRVRGNGTIAGVTGDVLFDETGATGAFANARLIGNTGGFTLWQPAGTPRFRLLIDNRFWDGWLGDGGSIRAWPVTAGNAVRVSFTASLPPRWKNVRLRLGRATILIRPGQSRRIVCRSSAGPLDVAYSSPDSLFDILYRHVIVQLTNMDIADVAARRDSAAPACTARG